MKNESYEQARKRLIVDEMIIKCFMACEEKKITLYELYISVKDILKINI